MATSKISLKSTLSSKKKSLNMKWQIFKDSVFQAAKISIKTKKRRPADDNDTPEKLIVFRQHLTTLNKIFAFVTKIVHSDIGTNRNRTSTSYSQLQHIWSGRTSKPSLSELYKDITMEFPFHIDNINIPIVISNNTLPHFVTFKAEVTALRNLVRVQRTLLETSYNESLIKEYEDNRCANYAVNKAAFIASSLNRSKRAIVLDRAMHTNANNELTLETDPIKVKEITNNHFCTIAGTPTKAPLIIEEMTEEWQLAYLPDDNIVY